MKNKKLFLRNKMYNHFMNDGKKFLCEQFFLKSFKILQKNTKKNHKKLTKLTIINTAPVVQMKQIKKKKRKTTKEFPFVLNRKNRITLSIKSVLNSLRRKSSFKTEKKLSDEIILSSQNKSEMLKQKKMQQDQILLKKKYVFFRWFC